VIQAMPPAPPFVSAILGSMDLPAEPQLRWILRRTASLLALGAEPVRGLVQPTGEFFPDRFDGSPAAIAALMARIQEHAGLSHLAVELAIVTPEGEAQTVNCSSGACGGTGKIEARIDRVTPLGDGAYRVALGAGEVRHPSVLTSAMVRAVSFMFLNEAEAWEGVPKPDREPLVDLAGVLLGFGVLLGNGAYIYAKGCGGVSVHSATKMPVDEITVALAIFCKLHGVADRAAARHLELTPGEHFDEAAVWASSNAGLIRALPQKPAMFERDDFSLSPARSWLSRALGFGTGAKKRARSVDEELAELERTAAGGGAKKRASLDEAKARKLAELKDLVDESLRS
jgi:hypothetical protein